MPTSRHVDGVVTTNNPVNNRINHVTGPLLTLKDKNGILTQYQVSLSVTVTLNGASANLSDLRVGDGISSTSGNPITSITATR